MLKEILAETRNRILEARDTVSLERARLVTEAYQIYAGQPVPLLRAYALDHVLSRMRLDLETNPILAGNTSERPRAWLLFPEYGLQIPEQAAIENPGLAGLLDGDAIPAALRIFWQDRNAGGESGWGHFTVDYARVLANGLSGLGDLAELDSKTAEPERRMYRQAMRLACQAVVKWAERYAQAAWQRAVEDPYSGQAPLYRRIASACRQVPAKPARNLFEALQSMALVHLALHIEGQGYSVSPGRLDQLLLPYYRGEENALEWIAAFWLVLANNTVFGSHSKTQAITIGGVDSDGRDASNPLTRLILDACELACVPDPPLFLRWHAGMADEIKKKAARLLAQGFSMPMLVGDEQTVEGLLDAGLQPEDAHSYSIIGCNELGIAGKLIWASAPCPEIHVLRECVIEFGHQNQRVSMDLLLERFAEMLERVLRDNVRDWLNRCERMAAVVPSPLASALMSGGLERGQDYLLEMPYRPLNLRVIGFTNVVNSLAALDQVIFRDERFDLANVASALENNFSGDPRLRLSLLNAPKWGNDNDRADRWALAWQAKRDEIRMKLEGEFGFPLMFGLVVRSLHHLEGSRTGATPDGRLAGEPLADSIGGVEGSATRGPTALLASVCKLQPARHWRGGYNMNLTLPRAIWEDALLNNVLVSMVDGFFSGGGQELQIASLSAERLHDAQIHPERHSDLMVRVAGFNARFIDLSRLEQDEVIRRAEQV